MTHEYMDRILVISEDGGTASLWREWLDDCGFGTALVESGLEFFEVCSGGMDPSGEVPHAALIDLDGLSEEFWNAVLLARSAMDAKPLLLVGLSTAGEPEVLKRAEEGGFRAVFPKHCDPVNLVDSLRSWLHPENFGMKVPVEVVPGPIEEDPLNRLRDISAEVTDRTRQLGGRVAEFGEDGPELFGYIESSGSAIDEKLGSICPDALYDKDLRHDFRNMIGAVTGFSELILMETSISPESRDLLSRIRDCSREFVDLLDGQKTEAAEMSA